MKLIIAKCKVLTFLVVLLSSDICAYSQDSSKKIIAVRNTLSLKIDGDINDEAWKTAAPVNGFVETRPVFNRPENFESRTEAWILYDDNAVYVGGFCHENSRDSISTELVGRDRISVNDNIGVLFDTYQDRINGVGFFVTALGEQFDAKYSLGNEDGSWSTVYETATKINDKGWTFEIRIPYAALRFSKNKIQNWGINFIRSRKKSGKQFSWSPIDPNKFGLMNQSGNWVGIQDIEAPVRLSFSPYFSTYLNKTPQSLNGNNKWETSFNGGMDVKYGLSKGFTLDMTLIPDFGQVQSDNQVLNLSPFEIRFNENRAFFTEGTELFNKGNLFYSRRIGGRPFRGVYYDASVDTLIEHPSETKLVNATKLSGRTAKGLGIGFFNALIKPQYSRLENKTTHEVRKYETNPWTNYNIIVLDQTMKHNSSITLVNTNVLRNGHDYDANVTAFLFDIYDKNVDWNVWGKAANSRLMGEKLGKTVSGLNYEINLGKFRGPFNFEIHQYSADENYQQNDMGFFTNNNYFNNGFGAWYKVNKPKGFYNNMFFQLSGNYSQLYKPRKFQFVSVNANANTQLKTLWNLGLNGNYRSEEHDYYEPRKSGMYFRRPSSFRLVGFISTNSAKKYSANIEAGIRHSAKYKSNTFDFGVGNSYRFNDKLTIGLDHYTEYAHNNIGFAGIDTLTGNTVYIGLRERRTVENIFNIKYNFNIRMGLTFRARHYWSKVYYRDFFELKDDGYLQAVNGNADIHDPRNNVNFFNIDMVYTWQFALGSFINIGWKSAGLVENERTNEKYFKNFDNTIKSSQQNTFSLKVIYFLDYLDLKKWKKKKSL